jgi:signal transduction histidine kinase
METDPDPAVVRRIAVRAKRSGDTVTIHVADTGPGVPARARAKLFRPFEGGIRAGGTGLGLAICAELVRAHGGRIALLEDGPGAVFELVIPDRAPSRQWALEPERG